MSMYYGATAKVKYSNDQFTNFIDLGIGVPQGDTLAPFLSAIVVDYVMRVALADQSRPKSEIIVSFRALQKIQ
jgi:hypothetical protein